MPVLDWIGKKAVVNHHQDVPYRLIHCDSELSAGDPDSGNLLVQGDNLEALKALLPYYAGKVKCIYIDPPYNTGNEGWVYNDNVNSPEIKAWLGKIVGKEAEDLSRHDKWLCMMYPRLRLLRDFLREDGVIFVSIDDEEIHHIRILMDAIFKEKNFISQLIWKSRQNKDNRNITGVSTDHEYILAYGNRLRGDERNTNQYSNPDNDPRGPWVSGNMVGIATKDARPNLHFDLVNPFTGINYGCPNMGWRYDRKRIAHMIDEGRILWPSSPEGRPRAKNFYADLKEKFTGFSSIVGSEIYTRNGTKVIDEIFGERKFDFPKPYELIQKLVEQVAEPGDIVMDSFSGSGTTGHAVLSLNAQDNGDRKFILVEMDEKIASEITSERLRQIIKGYNRGGDPNKPVEGLGGGFRYCQLGTPLFNEFGDIDAAVSFPDLAAHIFFSETGTPLPKKADGSTPLIGEHKKKLVYLLFSAAEQGFAREDAGNVLTPDVLAGLPPLPEDFEGSRVIYAEGCTVTADRLKAENIVFKQIPYQIEGS
ncbi:site-specific DNA-methyltransferase [Roseibium hamelinense]|nr:site-specific DNA-methyltransferase [Roseibium hamelinense]MTI43448.1 site-specific DNA-methyltransferase [Roseibium hamelinense]